MNIVNPANPGTKRPATKLLKAEWWSDPRNISLLMGYLRRKGYEPHEIEYAVSRADKFTSEYLAACDEIGVSA